MVRRSERGIRPPLLPLLDRPAKHLIDWEQTLGELIPGEQVPEEEIRSSA
jgi:hypothetical protein